MNQSADNTRTYECILESLKVTGVEGYRAAEGIRNERSVSHMKKEKAED